MAETTPQPDSASDPMLVLGCAALGAALGEGAFAARATVQVGGSIGAALGAGAAGACLILGVLTVPSVALGVLAGRRGPRRLGRGLLEALGGAESLVGLACLFGAAALAIPLWLGVRVGPALIGAMTPPFAGLAVALTCLAALAGALVAFTALAAPLARSLAQIGAAGVLRSSGPALGTLGVLGFYFGSRMLPFAYLVAPGGAWLGLLWSMRPRKRKARPLDARASALLAVAGLVVGSAATLLLPALGGSARRALSYRAAATSTLLAGGAKLWDRDGDGASPLFLGGDCDDGDAQVHPGARDVPGNGEDENCSGSDARPYKPPRRAASVRPRDLAEHMNLVVVLIDALRPDRLGFAGYARPTSPTLDALQKKASWFRNAYTDAPSTRYALTSLFTGRDVRRVPHKVLPGNGFILQSGAHTVAERLARSGYDTVGYTISYVAQHNLGLGQGFRVWETPWPVKDWERSYPVDATITTDKTLEYLASRVDDPNQPFFLFAHYRCTHDPYIKHPPWDFGDAPSDLYDSALRYCDSELARLFSALDARSDAARTALFVVSDHGELFGEHGLDNHGNSLYEPDVRVLLLAKLPGRAPRVISTPVQLSDLAPTLLELASVKVPAEVEAQSLLPALSGERAAAQPRPLFMFTELWRGNVHHQADAVLRHPYKYIADHRTHSAMLFDVAKDPGELNNLVDQDPEQTTALSELLDAYLAY